MIQGLARRLSRWTRSAAPPVRDQRGLYAEVMFDLTYEAALGTPADFAAWAAAPRAWLAERIIASPPARLRFREERRRRIALGSVATYAFDATDATGGALGFSYEVDVATPSAATDAPTMAFIHGHGLVGGESQGRIPQQFHEDPSCYHGFGVALLAAGRRFVALPNVIHSPVVRLARTHDHYVIWAAMAHQALTWLRGAGVIAPAIPLLGVAAGGHTAAALGAVDPEITSLATHGSFFPLDLCRREFVLTGHPDCFEFRAFMSYTPIFALLAPRPLWISMGRHDALSAKIVGVKGTPEFSGLRRGPTGDESLGAAMLLQALWSKYGAPFAFAVDAGGHEEFDIGAYLSWPGSAPPAHPGPPSQTGSRHD